MADDQKLEQMKQKYASVLNMVRQQQVRLSHLHIQDGKLFMQGAAPSQDAKNRVWNQIKLVNPQHDDIIADITVEQASASQPAPEAAAAPRTYTVQPGDSLSIIAKKIYGNANEYHKIFEANRDKIKDPNLIHPGQTLTIP
jgi:nucleoid-associated protein YgaU